MDLDFDAPLFSTAAALSLVPGLKEDALKQWRARRLVDLSASATGRPAVHTPRDIVQLSFLRGLTRQGVFVGYARALWDETGKGMLRDYETGVASPMMPQVLYRTLVVSINEEDRGAIFIGNNDQVVDLAGMHDEAEFVILVCFDRLVVRLLEKMASFLGEESRDDSRDRDGNKLRPRSRRVS